MRSVLVVAVLGALIHGGCDGCGDNNHNPPDASIPQPDAPPHVDAPPADAAPINCNYDEQQDATNDYDTNPPGVENTNLTYTGTTMSICGLINTGSAHYNSEFDTIDVDNYQIDVAQDSDVLLTLTSSGSGVANMAAISAVEILAYQVQTGETVQSTFWASPGGDHAILSVHLAAGLYQLGIQASDNPDSATVTGPDVPYALTISADQPTVRCMEVTSGSANYTEMGDGSNDDANDTVEIDSTGTSMALGSGHNTPENTQLVLQPSTDYLIDGDSAAVAVATEAYWDMDTYLVTPGPNTDQVSIRLNWTDQTANLDYYLYKAGELGFNTAFITASTANSEEFGTAAVVPGVPYWISVGEFDPMLMGSMSVDTPYSITICAETYVPPPN
jgi:hypothetical protein